MSVEINKDIDKMNESIVLGLTAKQLIASILSVAVGGAIVLICYKTVGLTVSAYIAIPVVAPIALSGFYSFNGMSFMQMMKKRIYFMFANRELVYRSTENIEELRIIAKEIETEKQKEAEQSGDSSSFDKAKRKMKRTLIIGVIAIIVAIGIACGCKFL